MRADGKLLNFTQQSLPDTAALNDRVLRTEKLFDLANISIDAHPDGTEYYVIYGALRATSSRRQIRPRTSALGRGR